MYSNHILNHVRGPSPAHRLLTTHPPRSIRDNLTLLGIVEQIGCTVTPSLETGLALLQAGDELSTMRGRQTKFLRFMLFCDEDGRDALQIDECDIIAYLGWLYEEGRVGSGSVAHYISAINTTLGALGIIPPADRSTSGKERILKARKGYQNRWIGTPAAPRVAMPFGAIFEIARSGIRALDHGVTGVARDCASIVFQCYTFGRPGLPARFQRTWIINSSKNRLVYEVPAVTSGRKAKDRRAIRLERRRACNFDDSVTHGAHPLELTARWHAHAQQWTSTYLFALASESIVPTRACQAARLKRAFRRIGYEPQAASRITAYSIRAGSASCALYAGVQTPIIKHFANWSQSNLASERDYLDVSYTCDDRSLAWFADLAT